MIDDDSVVTKAEFLRMLEAHDQELLFGIVEMFGGTPGAREHAHRQRELEEHNPTLAGQVAAVRKAREEGGFITEGVDAGFRAGPGLRKLRAPAGDDDGRVHEAERAIARRRRERAGR
jgi:hypothetical protein